MNDLAELWALMIISFVIIVAIISIWRLLRGIMKEEEYWHNRIIHGMKRQKSPNSKSSKNENYWQDRMHKIKKNWK